MKELIGNIYGRSFLVEQGNSYPKLYAEEIGAGIDGPSRTTGLGLSEEPSNKISGEETCNNLTIMQTGYTLENEESMYSLKKAYEMICDGEYWIASREADYVASDYSGLGMRTMFDDILQGRILFWIVQPQASASTEHNIYLRPVVTISMNNIDFLQQKVNGVWQILE